MQEFFGAHASAYTTSTVHARGASLERLVAQVAPKGHELVLDVATGTGGFAPKVALALKRRILHQKSRNFLYRLCQ